jgi:MYXO-CTERM domain-containing protein
LVGKIGTLGDEFLVGSSFSGVANDTGFLYLGFNDSSYRDNLGFFTVSTTQVPELSTAALLALGLAGIAAGRRRSAAR